MKTKYLLALAVLAVLVLAGAANADIYDYSNSYNYNVPTYQTPRMAQPATTGAGPATCCPQYNAPSVDCCEVPPTSCGAFCAAGQTPPGWPYNWCSEYWLRPNSNF